MSDSINAKKNCCPDSAPRYIALECGDEKVDWMIKCYKCGAHTKLMVSRENAVAVWNSDERIEETEGNSEQTRRYNFFT